MVDPTSWKRELRRLAKQLDAYVGKKSLNHQSRARLERLLMQGYYLLHKLMEDQRVDDSRSETMLSVVTSPSAGRHTYLADYQRVLTPPPGSARTPESHHLGVLSNKIIHSYLILPVFTERAGLTKVVICSDFEHYDRIIEVELEALITPLRSFII